MKEPCRTRVALLGAAAVLGALSVAGQASTDAASAPQRAPAKAPKARSVVLAWNRVPTCLEASSAPAAATAGRSGSLSWTSARRELRTPKGLVTLQLRDDEVVLTVGNEAVTIGADAQGRPVYLGDSSLTVWGVPDCDAPEYAFIAHKGDAPAAPGRRWVLDPRRVWQPDESAVIEFPGPYDSDTVVTLRDGVLGMAYGAADGDEKIFVYHPDPVHAFVRTGAASKYVAVIGRANDDFYRDAAARETLRSSAGQDVFDLLRARTSVGKTRLFQGRYLVVEGSAAGDFERHGAAIVDAIKDVAFFVLCDDEVIDTGKLLASSRVDGSALERGGDELLAAFRFAGFTLTFDDAMKLTCEGECHEERLADRP